MNKAIYTVGRAIALMVMLTALTAVTAIAQATTAGVTGRVVDAQGNVVPGARVTATNRATGAERTIVTNGDGDFTITELAPGRYNVAVEAQGFSRSLREDVELNVGTRATLNYTLQPGNVTETVTVTGEQPLVETTRSDIARTVTPVEIENLPLLNRTFSNLTVIAPEARPNGNFDPTKARIGNVAFNGGDGRQVNVNVDGGDNKDNVVGSLLQNFAYESIQEFQIQQHRWSADQGRAVGGVVNVVTKSGGNSVRGSVFGNFRHDYLQRRDFFDKQLGRDNPDFNRQEVGGSVGGPFIKDRLFYFFAVEQFRERASVPVHADAIRDGIALIPGALFVPEIPTPYNDTLLTAKIDHNLTDKQNMFYRFSYQSNNSPNDQVANPARTDLSGGNFTTNKLYSIVANHTYNFSPSTLNQFTFHFQDFANEILPAAAGLTLNFPGPLSIGQNVNTPQQTLERKYQFRDDFTWIKGNHTMKFGANYIHTILGGYFFFGTQGYSLTFGQTPAAIAALPQGFSTPGILTGLNYSDGASSHDQKIDQLAFYGQDDWKVTSKLTLNLGIRWDANIGNLPAQDQNRTIVLLSQLNDPRARAITSDVEKLRRTTPSWTEFQPRLGFAYDPWGDGKTVIRGGYGIFYDQIFQNLSLFSAVQSQPQIFQTAISLTTEQLATFRYGVDPLPAVPANFNFGNLNFGSFGRINDPDAREAFIQKWSIGFQRELGGNFSISSDYVHTLGLQEPRFLNINPQIDAVCDPAFPGSLSTADPTYGTRCPRGNATRYFDQAFIAAGFPLVQPANTTAPNQRIARLEQINMFSTNNRSLFDSWTTTLRYRGRNTIMNASYVLASSRAWGGQPTASYSGNGIAIAPENQFKEGEFGPTRMDERHRIVLSGVFNLPWGFQLAPIMQYASARPYSAIANVDLDGDGSQAIDRPCAGFDPFAFATLPAAQRTAAAFAASNPRGCQQARVNSLRDGIVEVSPGQFERRSGRFFNVDLRASKMFSIGERIRLATYLDLYNLFNTENLSFASRIGLTGAPTSAGFLRPTSLYGPGFGPPVGRPFTAQLGFRFTF